MNVAYTDIGDTGLTVLLTHCHKLTHLDINNCPQITEKGLQNIPKLAPQLTDVLMIGDEVTQKVLTKIARGCGKLKGVQMSETLADGVDAELLATQLFPLSVDWEVSA